MVDANKEAPAARGLQPGDQIEFRAHPTEPGREIARIIRHEAPAALCEHGHTDPMALCSDCEAASVEAPAATGAGEVSDRMVTYGLKAWFGDERYAGDYAYLEANFGHQVRQIITAALRAQPQARSSASPLGGASVGPGEAEAASSVDATPQAAQQDNLGTQNLIRRLEAECCNCGYAGLMAEAADALRSQAREEAQPVAWTWPDDLEKLNEYKAGGGYFLSHHLRVSATPGEDRTVALYTTPPSQPLAEGADAEKLRIALADLASWFTKPVQGERGLVWVIPAGDQGADDAVSEALAALQQEGR